MPTSPPDEVEQPAIIHTQKGVNVRTLKRHATPRGAPMLLYEADEGPTRPTRERFVREKERVLGVELGRLAKPRGRLTVGPSQHPKWVLLLRCGLLQVL